ncbi:unnamed protein product, partial [Medioppia subpectinata]
NYSKWYRILNYWSDRNISGPKPIPYFGNNLAHVLKFKAFVEMEWYKTYGPVFGIYECERPVLSVADPVLIKQILVKEFHKFRNRAESAERTAALGINLFMARDGDWKRIRAIASPAFTSGKLKHMYPLINECCRDFLAALDRDVSTGRREVELKQLMIAYTRDVIATCAYSIKIDAYCGPNNPFVSKEYPFSPPNPLITLLSKMVPKWVANNRLVKALVTGDQSDHIFFTRVAKGLMSERKKSGKKYNDFLQLLVDVEREDNNTGTMGADSVASDALEGHHVNEGVDELMAEKQALSGVVEKTLTEEEILSQCAVFFVAGSETTATTLSYCIYELALNPDIQDLLVAETKEAFNENTADIDYETLCRLPLLDA